MFIFLRKNLEKHSTDSSFALLWLTSSLSFVPSSTRTEESMAGSMNPTSTPASMTSGGNATCTFSRTFPNCGTYFFRHVSSAEEDEELDEGVRLVCVLDSECFKTSRRSWASFISLQSKPMEAKIGYFEFSGHARRITNASFPKRPASRFWKR